MKQVSELLVVVVAFGILTIVPVSVLFGRDHLICGTVGFLISVPPSAGTLWLTGYFVKRSPYGALLSLAVGIPARLGATLTAAGLIYVLALREPDSALSRLADPLKFWLWVLTGYLVSMAVETMLASRVCFSATPAEREVD